MTLSVIIPVYNAAQFLEQAVFSALQFEEVKEIVLIEDGSIDDSLKICKELVAIDKRVNLFQHANGDNKGAGASRNLGISKAKGDLIAFLDADDYYTNLRFKRDLEIFTSNPECDAVYGAMGVKYIDETGKAAWEKKGFDENALTTIKGKIDPDDLFEYLIGLKKKENVTGYFSIVCLTVKKSSLEKYHLRFPTNLTLHQDSVFIWQCAYYLKCMDGECEKPIAIRSVHEQNRFIQNRNEELSRFLMWRELLSWAYIEKLDSNRISYIKGQYMISFSRLNSVDPSLRRLRQEIFNGVYKINKLKDIKFLMKTLVKLV